MSLKQKLIEFLTDNAQTLREIYSEFSYQKPSTIRGRLNENVGKIFRRIGRGVYLATQGDTKALIIEGDAWKVLKEFCTKKKDVVLDPFGGSMSTARAGLAIDRHTISIEIDPNVIDKAITEGNKDMPLMQWSF